MTYVKEDDFSWDKFCDGVLDQSYKKRGIESKYVYWDNTKEQVYLSEISKNKWLSDEEMYKKY